MKILVVIINALLGVCCYGLTQAQPCKSINVGTKTLYAAPTGKPAAVPVGYQPVFINHAGRHGARHLTKPVAASVAYILLHKADSANGLTTDGKMLLEKLNQLNTVEQQHIKSISVEGILEQQAIATRMYQQYKVLFTHPIQNWKADVTSEIRTRQTAVAFTATLQQLLEVKDSIQFQVSDTTLRFYDLSPAYLQFEKEGSWKKEVAQLENKLHFSTIVNGTVHQWLTTTFLSTLSSAEQAELVTDIYGFYSILPSIQQELTKKSIVLTADSIGRFFTCKALQVLSTLDQAQDYFSKGPGTTTRGIQVKIAAPLLADFITTTDAFLQNGGTALSLRFCHAETIAPFAALLGLSGAATAVQHSSSFNPATWNAATVVPLSANVQWILYKPATGNHYLLKCLLNEREVKVTGLVTKQFPYYDWLSVRNLYLKKLQQLHYPLTDNGYRYLQQLQ
jgi:multiple inositol-polyphosphate phosphatase / 2,3-bisphosphoglycerate 3-phosphatase